MSERKMYDALKELASRKMIIMDSRPGTTSVIGLLGKESWMPFEDTPAPRAEGSAPRAEVPLHHVQTKYTSKVYKKENTRSSGSKNPHYEGFAQKYEEKYKYPYANKRADFVQYDRWKKADSGRSSDSDFERAVVNYLASPLGQHTFADLVTRFAVFRLSALDRFGKPVETKTPTPGSAAPLPRKTCGLCVNGYILPTNPGDRALRCSCQEVSVG